MKCPNCKGDNIQWNATHNLLPLEQQFMHGCRDCGEQFNPIPNQRMSATTPRAPDISRMTEEQLKAAGWIFERFHTGLCGVCGAYVTVNTYWSNTEGWADVRSGCEH